MLIASLTKFKIGFLVFFVCLICFTSNSIAQDKSQLILNGSLKNPDDAFVDGATVLLKNSSDGRVIQETISNKEGRFSFSVTAGIYAIYISYLGEIAFQSDILRLFENKNLGIIKLTASVRTLKDVVIQGSTDVPAFRAEGRKMIYDVQNSITAQGTNALEAIKKTPGVIVNQDNSITLNGTSVALVMVNGRQTYLRGEELAQLLKSMASSDLRSIEIIRNPSADYDASGTGGIINLVLKKSLADGFNGSINNGIAYGITVKQNTNLSLNFRKGEINVFGNYNHNFGHFAMDYDNDRTTGGKIYLNSNDDVDKKHRIGTTLGLDFNLDTNKIIGFVASSSFSSGGGLIKPITNIYDQSTGNLLQTLVSESSYPEQMANRYNANINYRFKGKERNSLDIDADYGLFDAYTKNLSTNTSFNPDGQFRSANDFVVANSRVIKLYALKTDYRFSIGRTKLAIGGKVSSVNANNVFDHYDLLQGVESVDIDRSNTFNYREQINAAYLKYEVSLNERLTMDAGVRLEHTHSEGNLNPREGSNQLPNSVVRNYLNLFPTLAISYKSQNKAAYNLSFSRRIDRPAYNNLNPFSYPVDELSYWKGNPFLQPSYAYIISLQYLYKKSTVAANFTHTADLTGSLTEVFENNKVNIIPRNIGLQNNVNIVFTQQLKFKNWWNVSLTGIGYYLMNKVASPDFGRYNFGRLAGRINVQQNFKISKEITGEIAALVISKNIRGLNTYVNGYSQIDLGFQKTLLKNKATLKLAVSDIFKTNQFITDTKLPNLLLHTTYTSESRQVRLNFSYRFGSNKIKAQETRKSGLQDETQRL